MNPVLKEPWPKASPLNFLRPEITRAKSRLVSGRIGNRTCDFNCCFHTTGKEYATLRLGWTLWFRSPLQTNDPTTRVRPPNRIKVVVGDTDGVASVEVKLYQSQQFRRIAPHNLSQLANGGGKHAVIRGGEGQSYSNGTIAAVHDTWGMEFAR
jgi:hypothetical protein